MTGYCEDCGHTQCECGSFTYSEVGVIVGIQHLTAENAIPVRAELERRFPGVTFAVLGGTTGITSFNFVRSLPRPAELEGT